MPEPHPAFANRHVFLSYASQDIEAARRLCEALRSTGIEAWFDVDGGLVHGDEWDAKIRRQIKECALFIPIISANTQARHEGYFRLEWELAAQRAMSIASGVPFILPVVIDDTREPDALVPDRFRAIQWLRLPAGEVPLNVQQRLFGLWSQRIGSSTGQPWSMNALPQVAGGPTAEAAPGWRRGALIAGIALTAILGATVLWSNRRSTSRDSSAGASAGVERPVMAPKLAAPVDPRSVAIMAFENLSGDKENEYFSDGVSEELLTVLQKIPGLHVTARSSAFSFKGKNATAREIGERLAVANLVEGSVRKIGSAMRIYVRLSRAATDEQIWSESYTRELKDIFSVQMELAQTIVEQLRNQLAADPATRSQLHAQVEAAARGGTKSSEAHELFLQGKYNANQFSAENALRAISKFRQAVQVDPSFARAWAGLANALTVDGAYGVSDRPLAEIFDEARAAAKRALALEPNLAEGYAALTAVQMYYDFNWTGAADSARRALELAPADPKILSIASGIAVIFRQFDRAIDLARRGRDLDPLDTSARSTLAMAYRNSGKMAESEAELQHLLGISPDAIAAHWLLGIVVLRQGRVDEAATLIEAEKTALFRNVGLAIVRWAQKRVPEADAALHASLAQGNMVGYQLAQIYAVRGDVDQAFAWLDRAYRNHDSGLCGLHLDLLLQTLHQDPRWPVLLHKVGLSSEQLK